MSPPTIAEALEAMAPRIRQEIQGRLSGFAGMFVKAYLPQCWVFQAESETASLTVDAAGGVDIAREAAASPDVTIRGRREAIIQALSEGRGTGAARDPSVSVEAHTQKGRAAFDLLRGRFGL